MTHREYMPITIEWCLRIVVLISNMKILIILVYLTHVVWAQSMDYYHIHSMEEIQPTKLPSDSLFGFSSTYDQKNNRMIISAPKENSVGEVYQCDMSSAHKCSKLGRRIPRQVGNYTHGFWFGATVKASSSFIVSCAPGFTTKHGSNLHFGMYGHCYTMDHGDRFTKVMIPWTETLPPQYGVEFDMDTLGWSLAVGSDESVIVGGPAMYRNRGLAAVMPANSKNTKLLRINNVVADFNFGYSVAVGNFMQEKKLHYAVGSTYGYKGYGEVYFYAFDALMYFTEAIRLEKDKDVDVVGSNFGAVLCVAKLNNTGDDLLVGAPTYAFESSYNEGAVYVYVFRNNSSPKFKRRISTRKVGSFFGSAIISVGDLNNDERDEVAIAAPYEDGSGAVYLFCGASLLGDTPEKTLTWLQRLEPKYNSFGLSLSALSDYDGNGCNELAVSSPFENKVMIYKCMAAVTITNLYARFPNMQGRSRSGETIFTFEVCMEIKYPAKPEHIVATVSTKVDMEHLHAELYKPNNGRSYTFKTSLDKAKGQPPCEKVQFVLPRDGDYTDKIGYRISVELLNSPVLSKTFSKERVILSDLSKLSYAGDVSAAECARDECKPSLNLAITSNISDPFNSGSSEKGIFNIVVKNTGEVAYDPCVEFKVYGAILYLPPMDCSKVSAIDDDETWECHDRKPVRTDQTWNIDNIIVNLKSLTNEDQHIEFHATVYDHCIQKKTSIGQHSIYKIALKNSNDFEVTGKTDLGEVVNMTKSDALEEGKNLEHIYTIVNKGLTTFVNLKATVALQKVNFINYTQVPVSYFKYSVSREEYRDCKKILDLESSLVVKCVIDSLANQEYVKIVIPMEIKHSQDFADTLEKQNVILNSSLVLEAMNLLLNKEISTTIQLHEAHVEIWIFVLAGLLGLIILFILAWVLYECGFLRRENKQKLQNLKKSVYRQSMRRSQMQPPNTDDRRQILDRMDELDEGEEITEIPQK